MSNPHRREWTDYDDDGDVIVLDGVAMATAVQLGWEDIESTAEDRDHIERSALRIRHGARAACKRLRGERDEARGSYRWMVERAADQKLDGYRELGARAAAAENERDAVRLELRALEWLTVHHPDELRALVLADGDRSGRYAYCAAALGW